MVETRSPSAAAVSFYRQLLKSLCSRRLISRPMIDPAPYKTIAVASTFSPRFQQVLSEAKRIRDRFSSDLRVIYVGERNEETTKKFGDVFAQLHLPSASSSRTAGHI
jgi:hypothetical protein